MKKRGFYLMLAIQAIVLIELSAQTTTSTYNNPANNGLPANTFTVPAGVTSLTVEVWGGGGGAGNANNTTGNGGGGGGGGGYSRKVYNGVVPGTVYTVFVGSGGAGAIASSTNVGASGTGSYFNTNTSADVVANGGAVGANAGNGGAGGAAGFGDVVFAGGRGGNSAGNGGGGGGSAGGSASNGNQGTDHNNGNNDANGGAATGGGGAGGTGEGNGGAGVNGTNGGAPGGGGGGSNDIAASAGGAGANGQVIVTYYLPQTFYSKAGTNWTTLSTWSTVSHTGANATSLPTAVDAVLIGSGHDITISQGTTALAASVTISDDNSAGCNLFVGDGTATNSPAALAVAGNITMNSNGVIRIGGSSNTTSRTSTLSAVDMTLNGTSTFTIGGSGNVTNTATLTNLTLNSGTTVNNGGNGGATNILNLSGNLVNNGTINFIATTDTHTTNLTNTGSILGNPTATTFDYLNITAGTRTFGDASNGRSFTVNNDLSISNGATLQSGNTAGQLHTINLAGNLANAGTLDLTVNNPTFQQLAFTGTVAKSITGAGTFNLSSLLISKNTANVTVSATTDISISSSIDFSAGTSALLVVGANSNIVLQSSPVYATITGAGSTKYIQLDGGSGLNSNLRVVSDGTTGRWQFTFPIGTATGGYTPVTIPTVSTAPDANSTLDVKAIYGVSVTGQLRRTFRITVAGNDNGTTFSGAVFNYRDYVTANNSGSGNIDISTGDLETDYTSVYRSESGALVSIASTIDYTANTFTVTGGTVATAVLNTGAYSYTMGKPVSRVWYSYQTGNFNDFNTWTLDPSGTTFDNGLNLYPTTGDEIHVLNAFTVTVNVNSRTLIATEIEAGGILNIGSTTGHNLGTVTGTGVLRIQGTSLPSGTYTDFVASTGGTIEYYNTTGTLSTTQTEYNNLRLTNTTGTATFTLISGLTVNGTFEIGLTGSGIATWQINDGTASQRTINLYGDLNVGTNGRITVGTGNEGTDGVDNANQHLLTIYGSLTNNGVIKFFDPTDPELDAANYGVTYPVPTTDLHRNELQGNAVRVTFAGTTDETLTCNNTTDFYRLILNKGTGQQAVLTVNSSNASYFRLFGPSNKATVESGNSWEYTSSNALSISNGTLELTGTINIPNLCIGATTTDYFPIPRNGAIWLNGANVSVSISDTNPAGPGGNTAKDCRILMSGLLRITNGTLNGGYSKGLGSQDGGSYLQEGGTVNCWQFRPRATGTGIFSFAQTGGTLNVGYGYALSGGSIDQYEDDYSRFDLNSPNSTFQMSGSAVLNVAKPTSHLDTGFGADGTPDDGGLFFVASTSGNYNITGGTVNLYLGQERSDNSSYRGYITSTAPLYNLNIYEESTTTETAQARTSSLVVLNNLTINAGSDLSTTFIVTSNYSLTVGGSFTINANTTYTPSTGTGTTTFNGTGAQTWTNSGTISALANLEVNKASGTLTLAAGNGFPNTGSITNLTLTAGTLDIGANTLTATGSITNSLTQSGSGEIVVNGPVVIGGNNGTFSSLTVQTNNPVTVSGTQTITGALRLVGANTVLDIGNNALTVGVSAASPGFIYSDAATGTTGFGATKLIKTSGLHNAGGLTRQGSAGDLLFPLGTGSLYTPNTINVTAGTHGKITVRPVNSEHPNITAPALPATTPRLSLQYYWRVTATGYVSVTNATHKSYTFNSAALLGSASNQYRPARYDPSTFEWSYDNTPFDATVPTGTTIIPDFRTRLSTWYNSSNDKIDGEFTCGLASAFDVVRVFYSVNSGGGPTWNWTAATSWTLSSDHVTVNNPGGDYPCATCPVIIGDGAGINHTITINANNLTCGTLSLNTGSTLDLGTTDRSPDLGTNTTGRGTLRIGYATFPTGDFVNFLGSGGGTVEWYGTGKTIPPSYTAPNGSSQNLNSYYNLVINPTSANTIILPASDITIYNDLTVTGATARTNGVRAINIANDLVVSSTGSFNFNSAASSTTTLTIAGDILNDGIITRVATAGNQTNTHVINLTGNLTSNGTLNLREYQTASRFNVVNLNFTGAANVSFGGTGTGGTTLNLVTVNKGTSQTPTVTFNLAGALTTTPLTTTAATGVWLTLVNGTFDYQYGGSSTVYPTSGYTIDALSTSSYSIPVTAKLKASAGTLAITSGNGGTNDLLLNGALEVAGGTLYTRTAAATGSDNDIEYAAAGNPSITVSAGSLIVDGAIRRSTSTITGALVYNQSGGTVTVGGNGANSTRGVFEIDYNSGSSFTMTGTSALNVYRQNGGTGYASLYINPQSSNVSATSTIAVGLSSIATNTGFRVNIVPLIGNFTVVGTNTQTVQLYGDLATGGNLTITSPSVLSATPLTPDANVTIAGNFDCTGTYTSGTNTTTFNGTGAQSAVMTSTTDFYDVTVNKPSGTVTVSGTAPAAPGLNNLSILSGTLEVGASGTPLTSTLKVNRDITINGTQTGTQSIEVYSTTGISNTITSSNGQFANLILGGTDAAARVIDVDGNLGITGSLTFNTNRYLMIGSNLLTFGGSATVTGAGSTSFVRTNGVSTDLGVAKTWSSSGTFVYPIGTSTNYTPVSYTLNVTQAGELTVAPVNSAHVTYNQGSTERILNYHWSVRRSAALTATGSGNPYATFTYNSGMISGSGGTLVAAYLSPTSNPLGWTTSGHGGVATTSLMTFDSSPSTNLPAAGSYYDFTVGTTGTLPNPILPLYSRVTSAGVTDLNVGGDWTTAGNWTTDTDGDVNGDNPSLIVPVGVPVVVLSGTRVNAASNGRRAFKITINGTLNNGSTTGHNLGTIDGTGIFRTATNTFPAGDYTAFVSAAGGTVEYVAPMSMNSMATYNNLSIYSGSAGVVDMAGANLTINGSVTIPTGTTLNNLNNTNIAIAKDWSSVGTFNPGTGTVTFNGSTTQNISGTAAFNGLTVAKSGSTNLTLSGTGATTVSGTLTMTSGHIIPSATHTLQIGSSTSGGSATSYISGAVSAVLGLNSNTTVPVGKITPGRYRPVTINPSGSGTWSVEYFPANPTSGGFDNTVVDPSAEIKSVSMYEYWLLTPSGGTPADITLSYGTGSYNPPNVGTQANLRVAHWSTTNSRWEMPTVSGGTNAFLSGDEFAGFVRVTQMNSFSPVTVASTDSPSPLPIELAEFKASQVGDEVMLEWTTFTELNNDYFTIERLNAHDGFDQIARVNGSGTTTKNHSYSAFDASPKSGKNYYRLKQTDYDGTVSYSDLVVVNFKETGGMVKVYPNPARQTELTVEIKNLKPGQEVDLVMNSTMGINVMKVSKVADGNGLIKAVLPTTQLSPGMYLMQLRGVENGGVQKVIIE